MKALHILIIFISATSLVNCSNLNAILKAKILKSRPGYSSSTLITNLKGSGRMFIKSRHVNNLPQVAKSVEYIELKLFGKVILRLPFFPYKDMEVLRFSPKFENYAQSKNIQVGKASSASIRGYIGEKLVHL